MVFPYPFGDPLRVGDVQRSMNAEHFTQVGNHASVLPFIGGDGPLELAKMDALLGDLKNFAFETAHGGFILCGLGSGRYDVHSLFLPEGRGEEALVGMRQTAAYMFTHTDCTEGRTTIPEGNPGAQALATRAGFEHRFDLDAMPWRSTQTTKATFLALTLERWALTSPLTLAAGRWFHDALASTKRETESARDVHAEEPVHDRMVGAAVMMVMGGQAEKAINFYNCWAAATRYALITLLSKRPCVIDVVDAVVEARANSMAILKCR